MEEIMSSLSKISGKFKSIHDLNIMSGFILIFALFFIHQHVFAQSAQVSSAPVKTSTLKPKRIASFGDASIHLNMSGGNIKDGTWVWTWRGPADANEQWQFELVDSINGAFRIHPFGYPNLCLDNTRTYNWQFAYRANFLRIKTCDYSRNDQRFVLQPAGQEAKGNTYVIRTLPDLDKCINIARGVGSHSPVILYDCQKSGAKNDRWIIEELTAEPTSPLGYKSLDSETLSTWSDLTTLWMYSNRNNQGNKDNADNTSNPGNQNIQKYIPSFYTATQSSTPTPGSSAEIVRLADSTLAICQDAPAVATPCISKNYSISDQSSFTWGLTEGIKTTIGTGKDSPVQFAVELSFSANQSFTALHSTTTTQTVNLIGKGPNSVTWAIIFKSGEIDTTSFRAISDLGESWTTNVITANIVVPSTQSGLKICDNLTVYSADDACIATWPAIAGVKNIGTPISPNIPTTTKPVLPACASSSTLQSNCAIKNISSSSRAYAAIWVPSGAKNLKLWTSGGTGDVDMYLSIDNYPNLETRSYDFSSVNVGSNNESISVPTPFGGHYYYVVLDARSAFSGVSLSATYDY